MSTKKSIPFFPNIGKLRAESFCPASFLIIQKTVYKIMDNKIIFRSMRLEKV